jgi:hypothetical protein
VIISVFCNYFLSKIVVKNTLVTQGKSKNGIFLLVLKKIGRIGRSSSKLEEKSQLLDTIPIPLLTPTKEELDDLQQTVANSGA